MPGPIHYIVCAKLRAELHRVDPLGVEAIEAAILVPATEKAACIGSHFVNPLKMLCPVAP